MARSWRDNAPVGKPLPQPPVLFLPGWGFSGKVADLADRRYAWISPAAPLDPATALSEILAYLTGHQIETVQLIGWSMGAFLAFDFACAFPEKVACLTLIGMRASWPAGEIESIRAALAADPPAFLQDFYRKSLLGYKKESLRFVAEQQKALMESLDMQVLGRGLDYLGQWRQPVQVPSCPISCWHGRRDIIAPVAEQAQIPGAHTFIIEHGGHALFLGREFAPGE